jgi:hypothetical protein
MLTNRVSKVLVVLTIAGTGSVGVVAQKSQDCRTKEDIPPIFGHWKDDQTNKEVDIKIKRAADDIIALYSEPHNCPHPDASGNPVPAPVDFEGSYTTKSFEGLIHVCRWRTDDKHPKPYTYKTDEVDLRLGMTDDGLTLSGHWKNPDTSSDEEMSLTRLSQPEYPFRKYEVILAGPGAKIYEQPDIKSNIRYRPAAGTRLVIYYIQLDDAGSPTWYQVTDARTSLGSNNYGWISANQVRCVKKAKPSSGD